ncbi:MAG: YaiI/YqxD family protein [Candidatus Saccharimonas sp.]|nr:YaiI/YqxD family protein [Planctomycetaceae bacterium]
MRIWIDGDACPVVIKELLFRAAARVKVLVTVVANEKLRVPVSEFIQTLVVGSGVNVADKRIVELVEAGDLVVTADVPLAAHVVQKGGIALNPRGELYSAENIGERITMRNLMDELRGNDLVTGGPAPFGTKDKQAFANQLDRLLAKRRVGPQ